jgi:3-keto-L-gulonate-6-phosphate decarboxylase
MQNVEEWCSIFEEYGVDGIALIRNIDSLNRPKDMLDRVANVRKNTNLPIFVSGGFTPKIIPDIIDVEWDIIIIGRAIVNSPEPQKNIEQILEIIHSGGKQE